MKFKTRHLAVAVAVPAFAIGLTACGNSSTTAGASANAAPTPTSAPAGAPPGIDIATIQKAQQCLQAAGIDIGPVPTGMPTGVPTMGAPGQSPPAGFTPPSGASSRSGPGALFNNPKAKAALHACGITLPSAPAGVPGQ